MGLFDGLFGGQSSKQKKDTAYNRKLTEQAAVRQGFAGGLSLEQGEESKARLAAAEQGRFQLRGLLGAPGTYAVPGTPGASPGVGGVPGAPTDANAIYQNQGRSQTAKALIPQYQDAGTFKSYFDQPRTGILDPNASAAQAVNTPSGQIMSQLTAESKQLLDRSGPLWDSFSQSVMGPIIEGAATAYKDSIDTINREGAKGGTARRTAVAEAYRINAMESANRSRSQELWQANLALNDYARQRATQQVAANEQFLDSVYRDQYSNAMEAAANFIASSAVPAISGTSINIVNLQHKEIQEKSNWIGKLFVGGISLAGSYLAGNTGSTSFSLFG